MRIVIAGVPFSPNMGDGLIAALVRQQALACVPGATIDTIDLAGRTKLEPVTDTAPAGRLRAAALHAHAYGPKSALDQAYSFYKQATSDETVARWTEQLNGADLVLIGPGQLISARTANFPTKLNLLADALDACTDAPPARLVGCGADTSGSWAARRLLVRAIQRLQLQTALFRDDASAAAFAAVPGSASVDVAVAPDLAVATAELPFAPTTESLEGAVYVDAVDLTAYDDVSDRSGAALLAYRSCIEQMLAFTGSNRVVIGSNGLGEDTRVANELVASLRFPGVTVTDAAPLQSPTGIIERASTSAGTVAVRLHALLPALAMGRPATAPVLSAKAATVLDTAYGMAAHPRTVLATIESERTLAVKKLAVAMEHLMAEVMA